VATASLNVTVITSSMQTVVPRLLDVSRPFTEAALAAARLRVGGVTTANSRRLPAGYVLSQSPAYGTIVPAGSAVSLVVSTGPSSATLPLLFIVDASVSRR
jgi:beta-lactam-binding protein with PASTA domain